MPHGSVNILAHLITAVRAHRRRLQWLPVVVLALVSLAGCSVNPVTGRNQVNFYSPEQQEAIGREQYGPARQSQGGTFNTDATLSAYVNDVGQRLAAVSDVDMDYEFTVLNNGVPNAWALPGGKIAVNRGLLIELQNEAELAAVLGHEIVHAAAEHGAQALSRGTLLQGALTVTAIAVNDNEYSNYIVGGSSILAQLLTQRYGRDAERESDRYGIEYMVRAGYDPQAAVSLQETFVRLSEGNNPGWLEGLFASHPPSQERVENNQMMVDELKPTLAGRDLETGATRYRQATAFLRENQEAYELFEEAQRAVADEDFDIAYGNLNEAIRMVPGEARFHGLQGDIEFYRERYREAVDKYDEAISLDDDYFEYYLGRGVSYSRLDRESLARDDLRQSNQLLPTALAQNELGKLALDAGERELAKEYFGTAAQGGGAVGEEARRAYAVLDVADNPAMYVRVEPVLDDEGRLFLRVGNQSPVSLRSIRIELVAAQSGGIARRAVQVARLDAGAGVARATGLAFPAGTALTADLVRITGISARP